MDEKTGDTLHGEGGGRGGLRRLAGIGLSAIGVLWLAHKAGWMGHGHQALFLPMATIAAGLFLVFGSGHRHTA